MGTENVSETGNRSLEAKPFVDAINGTYALTQSYSQAESLKRSLEALVLSAQHIVFAPNGYQFELRHTRERYPVATGRCYGDESQLSGIHQGMRTLMDVGPDTEPFYADKLAVIRGSGRVAIDRLYNYRGFDIEEGDRLELVEAQSPTEQF
jgi:hypothetical protein